MKQFKREECKILRKEMDDAFKSIEEKFGIKMKAGNMSYTGNEISCKVIINTIGENGKKNTKEADYFEAIKGMEGLGHLSVGETVQLHNGREFILSGYNSRARKSPIQLTDSTGRSYKCSVQMILSSNPNNKNK